MIEARPCKCGALPRERIGDGFPMAICGISMGAPFGTYLYCPLCGERTNSFREPLEAYNAWNRKMDYLTDPNGTPLTPSFHGKDCPEEQPSTSVGWEIYKELLADLRRECDEMVKNGECTQEWADFRYDMKKDEILESLPDELFTTSSQKNI